MTLAVIGITNETVVNTSRSGGQNTSDIAWLEDGGWVVTWTSGIHILQQRYHANGAKSGLQTVVTTGSDARNNSSVTGLSDGGWVVTWEIYKNDGTSTEIQAQRYDALGAAVGGAVAVNTYSPDQQQAPEITALEGGGYVVVWASNGQDGDQQGIYSQTYNAAGVAVGGEARLNTTTVGSQSLPAVAALTDGGYVAAWEYFGSHDNVFGQFHIVQRFNASGQAVGPEVYTLSQGRVSVAGLSNGGWVVTSLQRPEGYNVHQQVYDATGAEIVASTPVNTTVSNYGSNFSVTALADGRWVVVWEYYPGAGNPDIYGQVFNADGSKLGSELVINQVTEFDQRLPAVTALSNGNFVVSWDGFTSVGDFVNFGVDIYQRVFTIIDNAAPVLSGPQAVLNLGHEDTRYTVTTAQLLTGFSDANVETPLVVTNLTASHGTVVTNSDGTYTITPFADYTGLMTLSYTVSDGVVGLAATLAYGVAPTEDHAATAAARVNTTTAGDQKNPELTGLPDGWRVTWDSPEGRRRQDYDSEGATVGNETATTAGDADLMATLSDGTNVTVRVVMTTVSGTQFYTLLAQHRTAGGVAIGSEVTLDASNGIPGSSLNQPKIVALANGQWLVTWEDQSSTTQSALNWAIYNYDRSLDTAGTAPSQGQGYHENGVVTVLADGGFVLAYTFDGTYTASQPYYDPKLVVLRYDADGNPVSTHQLSSSNLYFPDVAALPGGGWVVAYSDASAIYYRIFNADGTQQAEHLVSSYTATSIYSFTNLLSVTVKSNGDFVIAWSSFGDDGSGMGVYQSLFRSDATYGAATADTIVGTAGDDLIYGLTGADSLSGGAGKDGLEGGAGNDTLNGNSGADTLMGGQGDDVYFVDNLADLVEEGPGQGNDTVFATVSHTLSAGVEALVLQGSNAINGKGNDLANTLTGNAGVNILTGGLGDDTYHVQNAGDKVVELSGEGLDVIFSSVSYSLTGVHAEVLTLTGTGNLTATGNSLANSLVGNSGNNLLDGGAGADTLTGGLGNDTFIVNIASDVVSEAAGAGSDLVRAAFTYTLGDNVEGLELTGTANLNGTGNGLNNSLTGNTGNNALNGGAGADTMSGGQGDDTYFVDNSGDRVIELAGEGADTVQASVGFSLAGSVVENLVLTGTANLTATGNGVGNKLTGNSGHNVLDGGAGRDTLAGGLGDDTYFVQDTNDKVVENSGEGRDVILSTATYTLTGRYAEVLELTGTANIDATGNSVSNVLIGNAGNNVLNGLGGNDTLAGGTGVDVFLFQSGSRADEITDFDAGEGDLINVNAYTSGLVSAVLVTQAGVDVIINLGGGNIVTVRDAIRADVLSHIVW